MGSAPATYRFGSHHRAAGLETGFEAGAYATRDDRSQERQSRKSARMPGWATKRLHQWLARRAAANW